MIYIVIVGGVPVFVTLDLPAAIAKARTFVLMDAKVYCLTPGEHSSDKMIFWGVGNGVQKEEAWFDDLARASFEGAAG